MWSYSVDDAETERTAPWPQRMRPWLDGLAQVRVDLDGRAVFDREVRFGSGTERIAFVDQHGIGVMFDKWGLLQRPFSARPRAVVDQMLDRTEQILSVMREDCGLEGWIAFGTLLGAAREGAVIGHDSDIDLAYLSHRASPAEMTREIWGLVRALRRHGLRVLIKSGSFITVVFRSADGAQASIDIYTCFYLGDLLYETATVRARVPREAVLPLGTIDFEGRELPCPADVDAMLTASYGPTWRVPDPSFSHQPDAATKRRFEGWFSSLMRHRRDWETALVNQRRARRGPSGFARWVHSRLEPGTHVVDLGAGTGRDARFLARRGLDVVALDYARRGTAPRRRGGAGAAGQEPTGPDAADQQAGEQDGTEQDGTERDGPARAGEPAAAQLNLYDYRDVVTRGALLARRGDAGEPTAVYARRVLEHLDPDGVENFWRLVRMVLDRGGTLFVECATERPADRSAPRAVAGTPGRVEGWVEAAGGRVVEHATPRPGVHRWVASWSDRWEEAVR